MSTKAKTSWACIECGHTQFKWSGQCPQCNEWNTLQEEVQLEKSQSRYQGQSSKKSRPLRIREISQETTPRILTKMNEVDRLIGGGIVPGSLTLIGGDPGIGKSTLLLQLSQALAVQGLTVLYVCGEESVEQTSLRAQRLGISTDNILLLSETNFTQIRHTIDQVKPDLLIIDSIQIVYKEEIPSAPGSVTQVRETASEFMHIAKGNTIATFLIGHVTKSGDLAGPRVLEHLVDTVLYFEGDKQQNYRMIRVCKNRFGPTDEIALFQMKRTGLEEVANPSQLFLQERKEELTGSAVVPTIEGSRPLLIEVQALVTETHFPSPTRRSAGMDQNRLVLLLAVLEKRMGYPLHRYDVFVSVAGGLRVLEPALDLGVLLAITSSLSNRPLSPHLCVVGEVGLGGEIRSVPRINNRVKEAVHMGFQKCLIPKRNLQGVEKEEAKKIQIIGVDLVEDAIRALLH